MIEKKVKQLVANDQVSLFVTTGQGNPLAYAGESAITAWFLENHGFEFKQKCAELFRKGDTGAFTTSSEHLHDESWLKNLCHLPLLEYHIDEPKFLTTRVIKTIYRKMMTAEGLSRSFGVEAKMPPWRVDDSATEEEKQEEREFWKTQIGCNPTWPDFQKDELAIHTAEY